MIIVCPDCATRYEIEAPALGPGGRKVRCSGCGAQWFERPRALELSENGPDPVEDVVFEVIKAPAPDASSAADPAPGPGAGAVARTNAPARLRPETNFPSAPARLSPRVCRAPEGVEAEFEAIVKQHAAHREERKQFKPTVRAVRSARRRVRADVINRLTPMRAAGWLVFAGAVGALAYGLVAERDTITAAWPQAASVYAFAGLDARATGFELADVSYDLGARSGAPYVTITGALVNAGAKPAKAPALKAVARNAAGQIVAVWPIARPAETVGARARAAFEAEGALPADAVNVTVGVDLDKKPGHI